MLTGKEAVSNIQICYWNIGWNCFLSTQQVHSTKTTSITYLAVLEIIKSSIKDVGQNRPALAT